MNGHVGRVTQLSSRRAQTIVLDWRPTPGANFGGFPVSNSRHAGHGHYLVYDECPAGLRRRVDLPGPPRTSCVQWRTRLSIPAGLVPVLNPDIAAWRIGTAEPGFGHPGRVRLRRFPWSRRQTVWMKMPGPAVVFGRMTGSVELRPSVVAPWITGCPSFQARRTGRNPFLGVPLGVLAHPINRRAGGRLRSRWRGEEAGQPAADLGRDDDPRVAGGGLGMVGGSMGTPNCRPTIPARGIDAERPIGDCCVIFSNLLPAHARGLDSLRHGDARGTAHRGAHRRRRGLPANASAVTRARHALLDLTIPPVHPACPVAGVRRVLRPAARIVQPTGYTCSELHLGSQSATHWRRPSHGDDALPVLVNCLSLSTRFSSVMRGGADLA